MTYGDAFKDMPEEYREYRERSEKRRCSNCQHWRNESCCSPDVDIDLFPGTMSRSTTPGDFCCGTHWVVREESEADKAIADGKPRWMHHLEFGWQYVVFIQRRENTLIYRDTDEDGLEALGSMPRFVLDRDRGLEILPYGETPPPAVPEKPEYAHCFLFGCQDRDNQAMNAYGKTDLCSNQECTRREIFDEHGNRIMPKQSGKPVESFQLIDGDHLTHEERIAMNARKHGSFFLGRELKEKPGAVASVLFQYEGGEWEHMAEEISISCPPIEMPSDTGWMNYVTGVHLFLRFEGIRVFLPPVGLGDVGELTVVLVNSGLRYEGRATVTSREDGLGAGHHPAMIEFRMNRSEVLSNRSLYIPDPLPDGIPTLNRCPDCDNTLEQRSMPGGIEEWCGECNAKVEMEDDWIKPEGTILGDFQKERTAAMSEMFETAEMADDGDGIFATTRLYQRLDKALRNALERQRQELQCDCQEPTEAEGPMHPDMIRAELQKAIDGGYRMDICPKAEYPQFKSTGELINQIVDGMVSMYTEHAGLYAYMNLDMIQSVKPYGSGE